MDSFPAFVVLHIVTNLKTEPQSERIDPQHFLAVLLRVSSQIGYWMKGGQRGVIWRALSRSCHG